MTLYDELTSALGRDAAIRLFAKFGGRVLYLPKLKGKHEVCLITDNVISMHNRGGSIGNIAANASLEVSTVVDILETQLTYDLN